MVYFIVGGKVYLVVGGVYLVVGLVVEGGR